MSTPSAEVMPKTWIARVLVLESLRQSVAAVPRAEPEPPAGPKAWGMKATEPRGEEPAGLDHALGDAEVTE